MDWLASGLVLAGLYMLGKSSPWGWVLNGLGSVLWAWYGLESGQSALVWFNLVLLMMNCIGMYRWAWKR